MKILVLIICLLGMGFINGCALVNMPDSFYESEKKAQENYLRELQIRDLQHKEYPKSKPQGKVVK